MTFHRVGRFLMLSVAAFGCSFLLYNLVIFSTKRSYLVANECFANKTKVLHHMQNFLSELNRENVSTALRKQFKEILHVFIDITASNKSVAATHHVEDTENKMEPLEVCPEKWEGNHDRPYFYTGWRIQNCANALPFHTVLSVLIYPSAHSEYDCARHVKNIMLGLKETYSKVSVIVANVNGFCKNAEVSPQVQFVSIDGNSVTSGQVWNKLVNYATKRYVLVGRNIDNFMWFPNLERPVHAISYSNGAIEVVGGAVRNRTGHWRIGCHQFSMKNYILKYEDGYFKSRNECMFCDYLAGPFVARPDLLKKIPFDESLPEEVLFEDFFLKVKQASHPVVNCPDVMYFATDAKLEQKALDRSLWLPLAYKWGLNRIHVPSSRMFSYSCEESNLKCSGISDLTNSFLIPICCLEQFANAVAFLDDFCRASNIPYEFEAGSVLGIVKVGGLMPWDLDGDCTFLRSNFSFFYQQKQYFKAFRLLLDSFELSKEVSYFKLRTPDLYIEMIGELSMSYDDPRAEVFRAVPTQALMHGRWVFVQPSPGLYSRNRYGVEMLRHTHSWLQLGMKGWAPYTAGYFQKCLVPHHHACLDEFSIDGNLQFDLTVVANENKNLLEP